MKIKKTEKGFILEMKDEVEFLSFYLLVADKVPQVLTSLNNYKLANQKKVKKDLEKLYKEAGRELQAIPLEQRRGKLFQF